MYMSRIINNPKDPEGVKVPTLPLLVVLGDGTIGEGRSIRDIVAVVVGREYYDCEDSLDEWHYRVECARRYSMQALMNNVNVEVYDKKAGVIKNNYAADSEDPDYEKDQELENPPFRIRVDDDKAFLISLVKLDMIRILERQDSFFFKNSDKNKCSECVFVDKASTCTVYDELKEDTDGCASCGNGCIAEYTGGEYLDIR